MKRQANRFIWVVVLGDNCPISLPVSLRITSYDLVIATSVSSLARLLTSDHQTPVSDEGPRVPSSRSGGLGRGLAGIIDDSLSDRGLGRGVGITQLVGRSTSLAPSRVRGFVTNIALGVIAEGFDAEAVVIARRDGTGKPPEVSERIPPSWDGSPGLAFELFGHLWGVLETAPDGLAGESGLEEEFDSGRRHVWLGCCPVSGGYLAVAVVRSAGFTPSERQALGRLARSVAVAVCSDSLEHKVSGLDVSVEADAIGAVATVEMDWGGNRKRCVVRAGEAELAVGTAAAAIAGPDVVVDFAGSTVVNENMVSLVLVRCGGAGSLLGLGLSELGDYRGVVEAVMSAVRSGN